MSETTRPRPTAVPERVLDLFAVPGDVRALGGPGGAVVAGDLVLAPGHDERVCGWLSPVVARLAVTLDERPGRVRRDLRVALPVPARDGSWVVEGWSATRFEPGATSIADPAVVQAAGRLLHAELAVAVPTRPDGLDRRTDRWAAAEQLAFSGDDEVRQAAAARGASIAATVERLLPHAAAGADRCGPSQLVHADLARNVLLDAGGAPMVVDVVPSWRPVPWAEAVTRLDLARDVPGGGDALPDPATPVERWALARAGVFRLLGAEPTAVEGYRAALTGLLAR